MTILGNEKVQFTTAEALVRWWADNWGEVTAGEIQTMSRVLSKRELQKLRIMLEGLCSGVNLKRSKI